MLCKIIQLCQIQLDKWLYLAIHNTTSNVLVFIELSPFVLRKLLPFTTILVYGKFDFTINFCAKNVEEGRSNFSSTKLLV